ncbi:programmed cell death 1 ligand 1-like [Pangasianodon hypophthalmus]|uniref:programmed cell death 1 ligand 1-like n=1 Tax=Pangasianodon hypophthalmus TaxID=310915 RepID=UPI0023072542|nr:programmed cell death 1 ligand 1-like [Pangasianodon hypophthalmus]
MDFTKSVCICILCFIMYVDSPSVDSQITVPAREGNTAVLPCKLHVTTAQALHVSWSIGDEVVFERCGEETFQRSGYEDRVDVPEEELLKGNCSLVLKNIRNTDQGIYTCSLMTGHRKRSAMTNKDFIQSVTLQLYGVLVQKNFLDQSMM